MDLTREEWDKIPFKSKETVGSHRYTFDDKGEIVDVHIVGHSNKPVLPVSCDVDKIEDDCYDSHGGETFCNLMAYNKDRVLLGYLSYSIYQKSVYVKMIEVRETCRRRGIGTRMVNELESREYPVDVGYSTPDGTLFFRGYNSKKQK
jgi:ribosomal protein S18 acetylase RimI-like enzyme